MRKPEPLTSPLWPKIRWTARLLSLAFLIVILRLWQLQVLEGDRYYQLSTQNRLRIRPVEAPRGLILDRNGEVLVENKAAFDVLVTPEDIPDVERASAVIGEILGMDPEEVRQRIQEAARTSPYQPFILRKAIEERTLVAIEERKLELPGVSIWIRPVRSYPAGGMAANLLGYVREVNRAQLAREEFQDLRPGASIGQVGIERLYDTFIRGVDGGEQVEVDALGRAVRFLGRLEPRAGYSIYLTIDKRIQEAAEKALEGKAGSVVAMNPKTGEVLALVSRPSFDPNIFAQRLSLMEWQQLITDPRHPFQNRPLQASYPPGSVFKLVTAIAALEKGVITPETKFTCPGYFILGNHRFDCWKKGGHGTLNLYQAIAKSCNVYFYNVALRTGAEAIIKVAQEFGLGQPLGLGLEDEATGFLPTLERGQSWYPGNTVMLGIGQGMVTTTPFQLLSLVSGIANGGTIYRPAFVKQVISLEGKVVEQFKPQVLRKANVDPEVLAIVRRGMWGVVNDGGTGSLAKLPGIEVAGKTGTAQLVRKMKGAPKGLKDHAWFVAFAPYDDPTIALVVNVEHGGMGGQVAAPIGRAILEAAFQTQGPQEKPAAKTAMEQESGD